MNKRLAIYCFYDKDGIVDDYVVFFLRALRKTVSRICCVVNGRLTENGRKALLSCTDELTERENTGFDAWAYAFFANGRIDELREYDELVLCNNSFFGPLYPLDDVFQEMESRPDKCDFWGITVGYNGGSDAAVDKSHEQKSETGYVQPYFMVFTRKVFLSSAFEGFFKKIPSVATSSERASLYEQLTHVLLHAGFICDCFINSKELSAAGSALLCPDLLVRNKCPFVKRDVFFADYANFFAAGRGQNPRKCLDYVKNNTAYNVDLIWQHILRTQKMSVLRQNLNLNYILSSTISGKLANPSRKVALVCYVYYPDDVDELLSYARNAEWLADLYFVSSRDDTLAAARKCLSDSSFSSVRFLKKTNKGRDLSTYLIDCAPLFDSYDYLCFIHDKKSPHLATHSLTRDFFRMCIESMLISKEYIINLLNAFEAHPRFGVAVMPPLNFGPFYTSDYWLNPGNREHIINLIKVLDLNVPFDKNPVAPYGDMFWCRTAAMKKLFGKHWTYDDLPGEPIPPDGTILHALERIHPFVVQSSGYYSAWVHPDCGAATYMNNIYYIDRTLNEMLFSIYGYTNLPLMVGNIRNSQDTIGKAAADKAAAEAASGRASADRAAADAASGKASADRAAAEAASEKASADRAAAEQAAGRAAADRAASEKSLAESVRQMKIVSSWVKAETDSALSRVSLIDRLRYRYMHRSVRQLLKKEKKEFIEFISDKKDIWDPDYYLKVYTDVANAGFSPMEHYLKKGWKENRNPSGSCVTNDYLMVNPDCRLAGISPLEHYYINSKSRAVFRSFGELKDYADRHGLEILKKSSKFSPDYYMKCLKKKHGGVAEGLDPYSYYLEHGAYDAVSPGIGFNACKYLERFPALRFYGICPVVHYELIGKYM